MSRLLALAVVCLLLAGTAAGPVGSALAAEPVAGQSADLSTPERFETTTFTITVYRNGSARWTFNYFTNPLNSSETDQFRAFADRFESEETELWTNFNRRAQALVSAGANTTGRNMSATSFQRSAAIESVGNRGQVTLSFRWDGFARVTGDQVVVSDIFDGEFYIAPNQWLVFETGPTLRFAAAEIDPQPEEYSGTAIANSDTITWKGEERFSDNRPRVVFTVQNQAARTPTQTAVTTNTTARTADAGGALPLLVVVVVLLLGLGIGAAWRLGKFEAFTASTGSTTTDERDAAGGSTASAETADSAADEQPEPTVSDEELLSDEDRVLNLLETNGGRMKQANIVEETGWSKSKVSMLLSDMEDDELISKLRVGRENIISLAGHEPDAAGSPFDDED